HGPATASATVWSLTELVRLGSPFKSTLESTVGRSYRDRLRRIETSRISPTSVWMATVWLRELVVILTSAVKPVPLTSTPIDRPVMRPEMLPVTLFETSVQLPE